jgi:hypothetical protein
MIDIAIKMVEMVTSINRNFDRLTTSSSYCSFLSLTSNMLSCVLVPNGLLQRTHKDLY